MANYMKNHPVVTVKDLQIISNDPLLDKRHSNIVEADTYSSWARRLCRYIVSADQNNDKVVDHLYRLGAFYYPERRRFVFDFLEKRCHILTRTGTHANPWSAFVVAVSAFYGHGCDVNQQYAYIILDRLRTQIKYAQVWFANLQPSREFAISIYRSECDHDYYALQCLAALHLRHESDSHILQLSEKVLGEKLHYFDAYRNTIDHLIRLDPVSGVERSVNLVVKYMRMYHQAKISNMPIVDKGSDHDYQLASYYLLTCEKNGLCPNTDMDNELITALSSYLVRGKRCVTFFLNDKIFDCFFAKYLVKMAVPCIIYHD